MWIPMPKGEFKSSEDRVVTARAPEALELYNQIIESKKKSRIMMHADELQWKTIEGGGDQCLIWLSGSPFGPERTVSGEFASPDELIVRDGLPWFTRFVRVD